jgi:hypothetical protein
MMAPRIILKLTCGGVVFVIDRETRDPTADSSRVKRTNWSARWISTSSFAEVTNTDKSDV